MSAYWELNPFGASLHRAVAGKPAVSVKEVPVVEHTGECRILFVSSSATKRLFPILQKLNATGLVTVGDTPGFAERGGVVNLVLDDCGGRRACPRQLEWVVWEGADWASRRTAVTAGSRRLI